MWVLTQQDALNCLVAPFHLPLQNHYLIRSYLPFPNSKLINLNFLVFLVLGSFQRRPKCRIPLPGSAWKSRPSCRTSRSLFFGPALQPWSPHFLVSPKLFGLSIRDQSHLNSGTKGCRKIEFSVNLANFSLLFCCLPATFAAVEG